MSRKLKNIIMCIILALLIGLLALTVKCAIDSKSSNIQIVEKNSNNKNRDQMRQSSEMNDSMGEPPDMDNNSSNQGDMRNKGERSEMPSNDTNNQNVIENDMPEPPDMNDNSSDNQTARNNRMKMTDDSMQKGNNRTENITSSNKIDTKYYLLFAIEGLAISSILVYMVMSSFNSKKMKQTFRNKESKIIYVLSTIILTLCLTGCSSCISNNIDIKSTNTNSNIASSKDKKSNSASAKGSETVTDTKTLKDTYESTESDVSAILVEDGGTATINGAKVNKTGDSTNTENSEFYGINAGILVTKNSEAIIKNTTITTDAKGANAVFSTGTDSKIYISDSTITTTGSSSSRGLDATYGGYIEADNVKITTQGGSCATLATDRGEGTVIVSNSTLETNGSGSPVIYSTGDISIKNTIGTANGSQMVVIEGKNSASVTDSELEASGTGNRGETDKAGIMIYQSMSGDASEGTGTFAAKNSKLTIQSDSKYYKTAPMFFITNTDAIINLEDTKLSYGSSLLISIKGTSEWGKAGSNGGNLTFNSKNEELNGNIEVDNISTLTINLEKSTYKGTINNSNTAKSITLKLDKDSKITLTEDSYVTTLDNEDSSNSNIDFNGYKLYVNGKSIN